MNYQKNIQKKTPDRLNMRHRNTLKRKFQNRMRVNYQNSMRRMKHQNTVKTKLLSRIQRIYSKNSAKNTAMMRLLDPPVSQNSQPRKKARQESNP